MTKKAQHLLDAAKVVVKMIDKGYPIAAGGAAHLRLKHEIKWFEAEDSDPIDNAIDKLNRSDIDVNTAIDLHNIIEGGNLSQEQKTILHQAINEKLGYV